MWVLISHVRFTSLLTPRFTKLMKWENDLSSYQEKSIAATFICQLQDLESQFPDAANLLKILANLDPENIPVDILQTAAAAISKSHMSTPPTSLDELSLIHRINSLIRRIKIKLQGMQKGKKRADTRDSTRSVSPSILDLLQSPTNLQNALTQLQNRSLIKRHQNDGCSSLWMHDLIKLLVLENTRKCGGEEWFDSAVELICTAFRQIDDPINPTSFRQCELYIPHIQSLTTRHEISNHSRDSLISANGNVARYLFGRGRYDDAQTLGEQLFSQQSRIYGSQHLSVLATMHDLARVYQYQGRYTEAEQMCNRALQSKEQQLGSGHISVLATVHRLASIYRSQGRYAEAEKLYDQVLNSKQQLGSNHISVLNTMHDLAVVYKCQGRYAEAVELFNRVLRSREQQLGSEHVSVLATIHAIAGVYNAQGRYADAEKLYNGVLQSRKQQLGSSHVSVLNTISCLAGVYKSQGRYAEAEKLYDRVLLSREQQFGSEHLSVLATMHCLAGVYRSQGRYAQAEEFYNRVLRSQEQQLGSGHVSVLATKHSLAVLYQYQRRYPEAEKLYNTALHCQEQKLRTNHADVLCTKHDLAFLYRCTGRHREAETLLVEVLRYREEQLGSDDYRVFWTMHELACIYRDQHRRDKTEALFRRVLLDSTENWTQPGHIQTVANIHVWVAHCHIHDLHKEVEATLLEVLAFREQMLGPHHLHTRETMQLLAVLYEKLERFDDLQAINRRLEGSC